MAWTESKAWLQGDTNQPLYQALLDDAADAKFNHDPPRSVAPA